MMSLLHLESLPPKTTKADLLRLICETGGLDRQKVGKIDVRGNRSSVEVPDAWTSRLVKALDGAAMGGRKIRVRSEIKASRPKISGNFTEDHFQRLANCLDLESRAEAERVQERGRRLSRAEAERSGESLVDLVILEEDSGLGGRFILKLGKRSRGVPLPWTRLGVGSPVILSADTNTPGAGSRGVVCERGDDLLRVALNELPEDIEEQTAWRLDLSTDEVANQRQKAALERARIASGDRLTQLRQVLLGEREPKFGPERDDAPLNPALNATQQAAIRFALSARDVALLHGPPGTGKTTAVVELIRRAIRNGAKVLACAPSNLAVDNMLERLLACDERAVRLGHPARVLPGVREHTLDLLVEEHPDVALARKLVKDASKLFRQASRFTRAKPAPGEKRELRQEARSLLADARRLEAQAVEHILNQAAVVCATTTGLDSDVLGQRQFDLAVIDEACQSTEPGCWIPLLRSQGVVLAGDHCQLPPTVVSRDAQQQGFGISLFERLATHYGQQVMRRLDVQYRMHESIMSFSSREFYEGDLTADRSVIAHRLCDLPGMVHSPLTESPLEFIDTAGAGYDEELEPDGESRRNPSEAALVCHKVRQLLDAGLPAADLAVIVPYAAQVRWLRDKLDVAGLEIDSVDGFQGREKEAVIIGLVRSNPQQEIGFLAELRRMNVALTRARRKLIVIGDSATISSDPFYGRLLEYFESRGAYHTVWEEDEMV